MLLKLKFHKLKKYSIILTSKEKAKWITTNFYVQQPHSIKTTKRPNSSFSTFIKLVAKWIKIHSKLSSKLFSDTWNFWTKLRTTMWMKTVRESLSSTITIKMGQLVSMSFDQCCLMTIIVDYGWKHLDSQNKDPNNH